MVFSRETLRVVPVMVGSLLLLGSAHVLGQQGSQSSPPDAPSANAQKPSPQSSSSPQTKTAKSQSSSKSGSKSTPDTDPAASNPFPMAQSQAAAKGDSQQDAPQSTEPMQNSSSPNSGAAPPATANPSRKSGQSAPAQDNPFPEAQSKAAAKPDDSQGSATGSGNSQGPGNSQAGSSSSKGGYSSSDAHLPDPDVGEGNLGTHPKLDSFTRDQNPDGRVDDDLNSADLYMKNGNYRGGYLRYQDALQFDPTNDTALYGLADALCKENETSEAMAHFKSYAVNNPQGKYARKAEKMLAHPEKCVHNR
ncbi:MAG: tetratricopeptide repeat protein [Acidobacteriaceae bacterium]